MNSEFAEDVMNYQQKLEGSTKQNTTKHSSASKRWLLAVAGVLAEREDMTLGTAEEHVWSWPTY